MVELEEHDPDAVPEEEVIVAAADGSVALTRRERGVGWRAPKDEDEVEITWRPETAAGEKLEPKERWVVYMKHLRENVCPGIVEVIKNMKTEETVFATFEEKFAVREGADWTSVPAEEHVYGGEITLHHIHRVWTGGEGGRVRLKVIQPLDPEDRDARFKRFNKAESHSKVTVMMKEAPAEDARGEGEEMEIDWWMGDGTCMDGLQLAVKEAVLMKEEVALLTLRGDYTLPDIPHELPEGVDDDVLHLEVRITSIKDDKSRDKLNMDAKNKEKHTKRMRDLGVKLFKAGRNRRAEAVWDEGIKILDCLSAEDRDDPKDTAANKACQKVQLGMYTNCALLKYKKGDFKTAADYCTEALDLDKDNVKVKG